MKNLEKLEENIESHMTLNETPINDPDNLDQYLSWKTQPA